MNQDSTVNKIKNVIQAYFPVSRIVLFGSRATKKNRTDSDYDLMVIIDKTLPVKKKLSWVSQLSKTLAKQGIDADILLNSEREIVIKKNLPGHIVYYALNDGIEL